MLFNSIDYLIFFPAAVLLYFVLPGRFRSPLLLAASYLFYAAWNPWYGLLLVACTAVNYVAGLRTAAFAPKSAGRRLWFLVGLFGSLAMLFVFKYYDFAAANVSALAAAAGSSWRMRGVSILLPIGISFYVFQSLSYLIDVFRNEREAERDPLLFALYLSFFPQLVAGPIERASGLIPQFREEHAPGRDEMEEGLRTMAWGFLKKLVLADNCAALVDRVFAGPSSYSGAPLALAALLYTLQIYGDFSGYSDIAVGSARIMGFRLTRNFERPYLSLSIADFWQRWHISLSSWLRDYVFISLGGSWYGKARTYASILVTFLVSGVWHGAGWTFIAWGAYHGVLRVGEQALTDAKLLKRPNRRKLKPIVVVTRTVVSFVLVAVGWVLFRARTMHDAWYVLTRLWIGPVRGAVVESVELPGVVTALAAAVVVFAFEIWRERKEADDVDSLLRSLPAVFRALLIIAPAAAVAVFGVRVRIPFIYFSF